eukprot:3292904-Amphidinium_carterae.1
MEVLFGLLQSLWELGVCHGAGKPYESHAKVVAWSPLHSRCLALRTSSTWSSLAPAVCVEWEELNPERGEATHEA